MKILAQALVLSIVTAIVVTPAMANTTQVAMPTLKQVATSVAQPHIDQQKQVLNAKEANAQKAAAEKVAKAKADKKAAVAKEKQEKAQKAAAEKQAKLAKEKAKADQKVQFAKDAKKTLLGQ